jgi:hypothetical protein
MIDTRRVNPDERIALDFKIRELIIDGVSKGVTVNEICYLLTRMLPELVDRRFAHGQVEASFDLWATRHPELMIDTTRFVRHEA